MHFKSKTESHSNTQAERRLLESGGIINSSFTVLISMASNHKSQFSDVSRSMFMLEGQNEVRENNVWIIPGLQTNKNFERSAFIQRATLLPFWIFKIATLRILLMYHFCKDSEKGYFAASKVSDLKAKSSKVGYVEL